MCGIKGDVSVLLYWFWLFKLSMMGLTVLDESDVSPVACFSKFGDYITHNAIYRQLVTTLYQITCHFLWNHNRLYTPFFFTCTVALPNTYQYSGAFKDNKDIKKLTGVWHFSCCVQSQKTNSMCVSRCPPLSTPLGFSSTCQSLKYYQTLQNQEEMAHLSGNVWRSRVIHTWRSGEYLGQRDSVGLSHS